VAECQEQALAPDLQLPSRRGRAGQ
jgi:hypothetical protein